MRRREFLGFLGAGIAASPLVAHAQHQSMPLIGFLSSRSAEDSRPHLAGFLRGLEAFGYVERLQSNTGGPTANTINYRNWRAN
jgi:putative tryptophan/tyrosine transport system substrate-binding protein